MPVNINGTNYIINKNSTVYFYESGEIKCASLKEKGIFSNNDVQIEEVSIPIDYSKGLCFYQNGRIKEFKPKRTFHLQKAGQDFEFKDTEVSVYENGKLKSATLLKPTEVDIQQEKVVADRDIWFYSNGNIKALIQISKLSDFKINGKQITFGDDGYWRFLCFFRTGNIEAGWLYEKTELNVQEKRIIFKNFISFFQKDSNENIVKIGMLDEDTELINVSGETKLYKKDEYLKFNTSGFVVESGLNYEKIKDMMIADID